MVFLLSKHSKEFIVAYSSRGRVHSDGGRMATGPRSKDLEDHIFIHMQKTERIGSSMRL